MGIRGRLILLIFGIFAAMFLIGMFDLLRVWQFNQTQLEDALKKRTELAAVAFEQWANSQQEPLATLAEVIEEQPIRSALISSNLAYLLEIRPAWLNLQIVDEKGRYLSNLSRGKEPPLSLIEDLLKKIKVKDSWVLTADRTENEERPIFTVAAPTKEGGAVIAQIDGESVKALFNDIELAEHSVVGIFNKDGRILYRRSSDDVTYASEIVGSALIEALGSERIASAEILSPFDGIKRVYGLARTEKTESVIVIGISSKRFYEPLWKQIYQQSAVGLLIFLVAVSIALFLAYRILHSVNKLKETTRLLAAGERSVEAPENIGGEMGELGRAFNQMARQINEREEKLRELDRLKSEFVSSVSHDLKTPLTTIKTLAHVLKNTQPSLAEQNNYLEIIEAECNRQILLVTNILDVSQIESGKYQYEIAEIDLLQILEEVIKLEKTSISLKKCSLELEINKEMPNVQGNAEALHRIFRALLQNAVKYTPEGGKIKISTQEEKNEIRVCIADSGCGIFPQDLKLIFDKFYRSKPESAETQNINPANGVGLGLYIAGKIVEQIGGRIKAANKRDGGAAFSLYLKIWEEDANG